MEITRRAERNFEAASGVFEATGVSEAKPTEGGTHRKRVATMARAYLSCHDIAPMVAESGLDIDDIVADLTGWRG